MRDISHTKSPTPALPQREVAADKTGNDRTPSRWGKIGVGLLCLILCGCITEYFPKGLDEEADILVVEGIITDDESYIMLSRSINLSDGKDDWWTSTQYIDYATVCVECDDGTQLYGQYNWDGSRYVINMGKLIPDRQYRLKIVIDEPDYSSGDCRLDFWGTIQCPTRTVEYCSDFSYPIQTPEIDSIFWTKRGEGQPVMIHVATHEPTGKVLYYRWSYKEDWEYHADVYLTDYPFYCWGKANNDELLLGNAEKTVFGKLTDIVTEMSPRSKRLSYLYRIDVSQNVISKRAYDYFSNIKKNAQQVGSIFAPIPSELRGNITCITDPSKPVIGYVDISTTTKKVRYIHYSEGAYDSFYNRECQIYTGPELIEMYGFIPTEFILIDPRAIPRTYVREICVDCTYYGGSEQKPDDWPN